MQALPEDVLLQVEGPGRADAAASLPDAGELELPRPDGGVVDAGALPGLDAGPVQGDGGQTIDAGGVDAGAASDGGGPSDG
ncbi:MAG: hypothetical protein K1X89_31395, partial [Myxococcaceae bacterium]|nr:hypothetical protein [Myxococcaceae bacterium]